MSETHPHAAELIRAGVTGDMILPWSEYGRPELRRETLPRYAKSGFSLVSLSLTSDAEGPERLLHLLGRVRREIRHDDRLRLISTVADIRKSHQDGRLAVSLNLQGTNNLGGDLNLVQLYYDLGVRQMVLVYNHKNMVGDGCHERTDGGLSRFGIDLIHEMNAVGMLVDCSHTGYRTSMEAIEHSTAPVIFSHSNPKALWTHDRNIRDDQAKACAARGGWIGAVGVGIFMGENDASTETYFRQIDYWVTLVGPEHVGLGTDYVYDWEDMQRYMRSVKSPPQGRYDEMTAYVQPEQLVELVERMIRAGYSDSVIRGILGDNYLRVAGQVWR
jgi:membrane dipeptidase